MTVDLLGTLRLLHQVLGFLTRLSAAELVDIANGDRQLTLADGMIGPASAPIAAALPAGQPSTPRKRSVKPAAVAPAASDDAEIVAKLREFSSIEEGDAYLRALRPQGRKVQKADLVRLGAQMGLTLSLSKTTDELISRMVHHAIGAKKKYAGLTRW